MHKAATAIIVYVAVVFALLAGTYGPAAARDVDALLTSSSTQAATVAPALTTPAPCTTDLDCEVYALRSGMDTTPVLEAADDGGEAYVCPDGMELFDTEMPDLGAQGVVCRTHLMEV